MPWRSGSTPVWQHRRRPVEPARAREDAIEVRQPSGVVELRDRVAADAIHVDDHRVPRRLRREAGRQKYDGRPEPTQARDSHFTCTLLSEIPVSNA
jgi:hypothetical protein